MLKTIALLKQQKLFTNLSDNDLEIVAGYCRQKKYQPCDIILQYHTKPNHIYFLTKGIVFIYKLLETGKIIPITFIAQGDLFGEMAILTNQNRCAYVEALSDVECLLIKKNDFIQLLNQIDQLHSELLKIMSIRLRQENKNLEMLKSESAYNRVLETLIYLTKHLPDKEISLCHEKLALIVGITRPRLSEIMEKLKQQKIINYSYKKIQVL